MIAYAFTESSARTHLATDFMPTITFIEFDGAERKVDARTGTSFLRAAHLHGADLEGACGGALSCATCHLIFADEWYRKFPAARADEAAILAVAFGITPNSRLGCQLRVSPELDGCVARVAQPNCNLTKKQARIPL